MVPGSALLIDDRLELIKNLLENSKTSFENAEIEELKNLWSLILSLNRKGIPVTMFSSNDINDFEDLVKRTQNIRLVILDLDIDGDGEVTEADEEIIKNFIQILREEQGYFFLFIYSGHREKWEDIKEELEEDREFISNMTIVFAKEEKLETEIMKKIEELSSLSVICSFERELNKACNIVAGNFIEFNKETWKYLICKQKEEMKDLWEYEMISLLLNLIKQNIKKKEIFSQELTEDCSEGIENGYDSKMISKIYRAFNYIENIPSDAIFTGNLYKTGKSDKEKEYALILTPECDIVQNKNIDKFVVVYGFNVNDNLNNSYDRTAEDVPMYVKKAGKDVNNPEKWRSFNSLNKLKNPNQYIYLLPFAIEHSGTYKHIALDFRVVESVSVDTIQSWRLELRVNEPLIVDIQDKFSNLFNRKGLPSLLPKEMKLIDESHS